MRALTSDWPRRQADRCLRVRNVIHADPRERGSFRGCRAVDDFPDFYNITPGVGTWIARAKDAKPALYSYLWGLVSWLVEGPEEGRETDQRAKKTNPPSSSAGCGTYGTRRKTIGSTRSPS